jgi:hypothetical protein
LSKFADDHELWTDEAKPLRDAEESNNPNREEWDLWMASMSIPTAGEGVR